MDFRKVITDDMFSVFHVIPTVHFRTFNT